MEQMAFGHKNRTASCGRINPKTHLGGGKMKKALMALFVLTTILVGFLSPLTTLSAKAQSQFPNCVDGVCTFPLARSWGGGDCEFNIQHTLDIVGKNQNFWLIPVGGAPQSFNGMAGSMNTSSGYRDITLSDGKVPGRCACDVASMFYVTGLVNGLAGDPDEVNHYLFPGLSDSNYSVTIWNPGKDLRISNPFDKDAIYRWKIEDGNVVMWVEFDDESLGIGAPKLPELSINDPDNSLLVTPYSWIDQLEDSDNPVVWVVVVVVLILVVLVTIRTWWTDRQMAELKKQSGVKTVYKKSKLLVVYWWLSVLMLVMAFWSRDEVIWTFTGVAGQIWAGLKVRDWVSRFFRHLNLDKVGLPWWVDLGKEFVLVVWAGVYLSYTIAFAVVYVPALLANEPLQASWSVGYNSLSRIGPLPAKPLEWTTTYRDIPEHFKKIVREYGSDVVKIAREEDVPPEVIFTLVLKEGGQLLTNPANGEGLCGFYDLVVSRQAYFTPGPVTKSEALRQFRLCAQEFKRRSTGYEISFETTDLTQLGPVYMRYNGNIDCMGKPFPSYLDHPYVMNGWDESHWKMVARDGRGGCVPLQVIGALPAHVRIGNLLRQSTKPLPQVTSFDAVKGSVCSDPLGFCGFALQNGPTDYIQGTSAVGGNDWHCNLISECGWDWWDPSKASSSVKPINVLSMLNGQVSRIGVYQNGTPYIEVTNSSGRKQASYHCDKYYVAEGDVVKWGQPICLMGNKGQSDWTHLHLVLLNLDGSSVRDQTQWWPK